MALGRGTKGNCEPVRLARSLWMTETTQVLTTALTSLAILRSVQASSPDRSRPLYIIHSFMRKIGTLI